MSKIEVGHTPGPWNWHAQGDANEYLLLTNEKRWVISFRQNGELWTPEQEANARLVAAAPDLLAALEGVLRVADRATDEFDAARAAIAKSTGSAK